MGTPPALRIKFLASCRDPRPDKATQVYGTDHETDIDSTDFEFVRDLRRRGMAEFLSGSDADIAEPPAA